ncbi:MAG TPA: bifunctional hydroxymethylpyrimidine kinase/phosphomethylpyrimidine kinase [Aestuariivirgaceae bacterium]|jgi:hydroxymethylpyrimidine/phosphomethylpyrimidine kinase
MTAIALTIAGSDSGGGAGIQADLKTFSALGVYGASVITALTAQNTVRVEAVHVVPADFVLAQMRAVADDLQVDAIKIGMLATAPVIEAVAEGLKDYRGVPVVLDPVMIAASGDPLLDPGAVDALRRLIPLATLITPNLAEAAALLACSPAGNEYEMAMQAWQLKDAGAKAVLIKGGHGEGSTSIDILFAGVEPERLEAPRVATRNTHGTGCTLSSAIAAELAKGASLPDAVATAKDYVTAAIRNADMLDIGSGKGRGPVHHFHAWWKRKR